MIFVQLIGCSSRITDEYNNPVLNLQESSYSLGASDVRAVEKKQICTRVFQMVFLSRTLRQRDWLTLLKI